MHLLTPLNRSSALGQVRISLPVTASRHRVDLEAIGSLAPCELLPRVPSENILVQKLNVEKTCDILNLIMEYELAGVVRYTHYALMVTGPHRLPIVEFMQGQASESLTHAQQAGEILTGLGGHPTQGIASIEETHLHDIYNLLCESLAHEEKATSLYKDLLEAVSESSVYIEEYARQMIGQEEMHTLELRKMLRDFEPNSSD